MRRLRIIGSGTDRRGARRRRPEVHEVFDGGWAPLRAPLKAHWLPFVRGETSREEAARRLLAALATPP